MFKDLFKGFLLKLNNTKQKASRFFTCIMSVLSVLPQKISSGSKKNSFVGKKLLKSGLSSFKCLIQNFSQWNVSALKIVRSGFDIARYRFGLLNRTIYSVIQKFISFVGISVKKLSICILEIMTKTKKDFFSFISAFGSNIISIISNFFSLIGRVISNTRIKLSASLLKLRSLLSAIAGAFTYYLNKMMNAMRLGYVYFCRALFSTFNMCRRFTSLTGTRIKQSVSSLVNRLGLVKQLVYAVCLNTSRGVFNFFYTIYKNSVNIQQHVINLIIKLVHNAFVTVQHFGTAFFYQLNRGCSFFRLIGSNIVRLFSQTKHLINNFIHSISRIFISTSIKTASQIRLSSNVIYSYFVGCCVYVKRLVLTICHLGVNVIFVIWSRVLTSLSLLQSFILGLLMIPKKLLNATCTIISALYGQMKLIVSKIVGILFAVSHVGQNSIRTILFFLLDGLKTVCGLGTLFWVGLKFLVNAVIQASVRGVVRLGRLCLSVTKMPIKGFSFIVYVVRIFLVQAMRYSTYLFPKIQVALVLSVAGAVNAFKFLFIGIAFIFRKMSRLGYKILVTCCSSLLVCAIQSTRVLANVFISMMQNSSRVFIRMAVFFRKSMYALMKLIAHFINLLVSACKKIGHIQVFLASNVANLIKNMSVFFISAACLSLTTVKNSLKIIGSQFLAGSNVVIKNTRLIVRHTLIKSYDALYVVIYALITVLQGGYSLLCQVLLFIIKVPFMFARTLDKILAGMGRQVVMVINVLRSQLFLPRAYPAYLVIGFLAIVYSNRHYDYSNLSFIKTFYPKKENSLMRADFVPVRNVSTHLEASNTRVPVVTPIKFIDPMPLQILHKPEVICDIKPVMETTLSVSTEKILKVDEESPKKHDEINSILTCTNQKLAQLEEKIDQLSRIRTVSVAESDLNNVLAMPQQQNQKQNDTEKENYISTLEARLTATQEQLKKLETQLNSEPKMKKDDINTTIKKVVSENLEMLTKKHKAQKVRQQRRKVFNEFLRQLVDDSDDDDDDQ